MMFKYLSVVLAVGLSLTGADSRQWGYRFEHSPMNQRPIVGVVAQEISLDSIELFGDYELYKVAGHWYSYIAASYVKFIEGGGARVIPIWIGKPRKYYEKIMKRVNGVLFPGGDADFVNNWGYAQAGRYIYEIANEMNARNEYFPLWGTCLGFELLAYLGNNNTDLRTPCDAQGLAQNLEFKDDFMESRLFKEAPQRLIDILQEDLVAANFHHFCVTEQNMTKAGMNDWRIISTNKDSKNLEFVSSFEHKRYPYYGVQFHPEKNIYEWTSNNAIVHTRNAIRTSQYFAEFFVEETRKNPNNFKTTGEENRYLIYNWPAQFTGRNGSTLEQMYLFDLHVGEVHLQKLD